MPCNCSQESTSPASIVRNLWGSDPGLEFKSPTTITAYPACLYSLMSLLKSQAWHDLWHRYAASPCGAYGACM